MQTIEIKTLVDITDTKVIRLNQGTQFEHDQYRNFVTLKQCIEIRSIISYNGSPSIEIVDIKDMGFGSAFKGKHAVWTFKFTPDRSGVYFSNGKPLGSLIEDINGVPVVLKLKETINIEKAIFDLTDLANTNTTIKES